MNEIDIHQEENLDFIAMEKGIPLKIWYLVADEFLDSLK